jgi:5'-methylthioinosine phosphorylase
MTETAIIGGTGLGKLQGLEITERRVVDTPFGAPSAPLCRGVLFGVEVVFLARHGESHTVPPHRINYRANIHALRDAGIRRIIAVAAVGGIHPDLTPGRLAIPDQIIDYTSGREATFFEDGLNDVVHVDFTEPYCAVLRKALLSAARAADLDVLSRGTYGATQGPRLETAAEIDRMERDGCDMVGMTGMPEAALARELDISYATCAVAANAAAGRGRHPITMADIVANLEDGMKQVRALLIDCLPTL